MGINKKATRGFEMEDESTNLVKHSRLVVRTVKVRKTDLENFMSPDKEKALSQMEHEYISDIVIEGPVNACQIAEAKVTKIRIHKLPAEDDLDPEIFNADKPDKRKKKTSVLWSKRKMLEEWQRKKKI